MYICNLKSQLKCDRKKIRIHKALKAPPFMNIRTTDKLEYS